LKFLARIFAFAPRLEFICMYESTHRIAKDGPAEITPAHQNLTPLPARERFHPSRLLLQKIGESETTLEARHVMMGIGFGREGTPLDVATMILAAGEAASIKVLIIDEFRRMNGVSEDEIERGSMRLIDVLERLKEKFGLPLEIIKTSDLMATDDYHRSFLAIAEIVSERMKAQSFREAMLATLPESKRRDARPDLTYSVHEIAVTAFMANRFGTEVKLGPSRETLYDGVMRQLGVAMSFAYAVDALPVATNKPEPVVHYVPSHRGGSGGQRLCFEDSRGKIKRLLECASEEAAHYYSRLAQTAAALRGDSSMQEVDLSALKRNALVRTCRDGILRHLVEAVMDE
jgi:hypothetical protein